MGVKKEQNLFSSLLLNWQPTDSKENASEETIVSANFSNGNNEIPPFIYLFKSNFSIPLNPRP